MLLIGSVQHSSVAGAGRIEDSDATLCSQGSYWKLAQAEQVSGSVAANPALAQYHISPPGGSLFQAQGTGPVWARPNGTSSAECR